MAKMLPTDWDSVRYFNAREFTSPAQMDRDFIRKLDSARALAHVPFVITSSYRTAAHNESVGGAQNSAHMRGLAVDILTPTSPARYQILRGLIAAGFTRLGFYRNHIHADADLSLAQEVAWYA